MLDRALLALAVLSVAAAPACGGGDDQGIAQTPARTNTQTTQTSTTEEGSQVRVVLNEESGSGITGTATLSRDGDKTEVQVELEGARTAAVAIHPGTCDDLSTPPAETLTGMQDGSVNAQIETSIQELTAETHSVVVGEADRPQACGEIRSSQG